MSKTRTTMSLTTGTFPVMNGIHYISNHVNITDHSDVTVIGSFANILDELGTTNDATVEVPPGNYDFQGNTIVIPDNIQLKCNKGTLFSNGTFVMNSPPEAGDYKIYDSDFYTTYNRPAVVNPAHYGLIINDETEKDNNTTKFIKMLTGLYTGSIVTYNVNAYYLDETWCSENEETLTNLCFT